MDLEQLMKLLAEARAAREAASAKVNELIAKASKADYQIDQADVDLQKAHESRVKQLRDSIASLETQIDDFKKDQERAGKSIDKPIDPPNPVNAGKKDPHITTNELDESGGFSSLGEFMVAAAKSTRPGHMDERLMKLNKAAGDTRLLNDGAFMIPKQQATSILETAWQTGVITARIPKTEITVGNTLHYLEMDDKDLSAGKVAGGVAVAWQDEGDALAATGFKLNPKELNLKELGAYIQATDNMLEDAPAFEATGRRMIDKAISYELDKAVLYYDGLNKPMGMLHAQNKALITVAKETQTDKLCAENFNKMYAHLPEDLVDGAVWVLHPQAKEILPLLNNAAKNLTAVYTGPMIGYDGKQTRPTILGIPVVFHASAKALGSLGDCALIAPSEYTMIAKGGLKVDMSIHVQFLNSKTVFRFRMRINGKPAWSAPMTLENGGFQLSPYIILQGGR